MSSHGSDTWFKPETEAETEVLTRNLEVLQILADTRHQDT